MGTFAPSGLNKVADRCEIVVPMMVLLVSLPTILRNELPTKKMKLL